MKRLSILFVGLLAMGMIFSIAGVAREMDFAEATLSFDSVLDITVTDNLEDLEDISQADLRDLADEGSAVMDFTGDLTVRVLALTSFNVGATYLEGEDDEQSGDLLLLDGADGIPHFNDRTFGQAWSTGDDKPDYDGTSVLSLTDDFGTSEDGNNLPEGDENTYGLSIDLAELTEEYEDGDSINFEVSFWAYDANT